MTKNEINLAGIGFELRTSGTPEQDLNSGPLARQATTLTTTPWISTVNVGESYEYVSKDYLTFQFSKLNQIVCKCMTLLISSLCMGTSKQSCLPFLTQVVPFLSKKLSLAVCTMFISVSQIKTQFFFANSNDFFNNSPVIEG